MRMLDMTDPAFLVQQTQDMRRDLLAFLKPLPTDVLKTSLPEYGQGSILSTLTRVADSFGRWAGTTLLEEPWDAADTPGDLQTLSAWFARVDALLERALACPRMQSGEAFETVDFEGNRRWLTARWVVLHWFRFLIRSEAGQAGLRQRKLSSEGDRIRLGTCSGRP